MSESLPSRAAPRPGFRLDRVEVFNWGTFNRHVWALNCGGENVLLTGDIGSGKSTLVDAVTTLLIAPQRITFNRAAGAETRERTLRSYVLGYHRSERGDSGAAARPVALRDQGSYSVVLARFSNAVVGQTVTIAQVFWWKEAQGQPARLYIVADTALAIADHFADFGGQIDKLRKRLRGRPGVELHDSYSSYGAAFRRRLGIESEQALDLFYQTVSMKSVGNLTEFVREHMLEAFPVEDRIAKLLEHFDHLTRAHEAVLRTKEQIALLTPLIARCDEHDAVSARSAELRLCRDALRAWFAELKDGLLATRIAELDQEIERGSSAVAELVPRLVERRLALSAIERDIAVNGGERLAQIRVAIIDRQQLRDSRSAKAARYAELAGTAGLLRRLDDDSFASNREAIARELARQEPERAKAQESLTNATVDFRQLKSQHDVLVAEITSLRGRRSSIPENRLELRRRLSDAVGIAEDQLPFAGELIQVRPDARAWEGAIERILHHFALSVLVGDADYARVSDWVDRTHLHGRLVYYRARAQRVTVRDVSDPRSLVHMLEVQSASPFYDWIDAELTHRFDYACCESLDNFRRAERAVTRAGQIKGSGDRHEKDDRRHIDDRTNYVLGWTNAGKIAALERQAADIAARGEVALMRRGGADTLLRAIQSRGETLKQLTLFESYSELDWRSTALEIDQFEEERKQLDASSSDALRALREQHDAVQKDVDRIEKAVRDTERTCAGLDERRDAARKQRVECVEFTSQVTEDLRVFRFPRLMSCRLAALGERPLTVESCDRDQQDIRKWLQDQIDADDKKASRLAEEIVSAMRGYIGRFPQETREVDASVAAAGEYRTMLSGLVSDDLPRFEERFKELLNENTIREIANFQSQLNKERHTINERVAVINRSLRDIDYNDGRYITLEAEASTDTEVRDFQQRLRACTEDSLTGSQADSYSEAKFLQVRDIIGRFRGREGLVEPDRRWTAKVTDVRRWFVFSASERWRHDNVEHEHYADSGGKSGGQKEKLAYTVLAASLAYQFGIGAGASRPRSFHFVLIDEAFGRGSDESARFGLELFGKLGLQLLVVTPMQKIHVIEPFVANVGFVHNADGNNSMVRNLTIEEYRAERAARGA